MDFLGALQPMALARLQETFRREATTMLCYPLFWACFTYFFPCATQLLFEIFAFISCYQGCSTLEPGIQLLTKCPLEKSSFVCDHSVSTTTHKFIAHIKKSSNKGFLVPLLNFFHGFIDRPTFSLHQYRCFLLVATKRRPFSKLWFTLWISLSKVSCPWQWGEKFFNRNSIRQSLHNIAVCVVLHIQWALSTSSFLFNSN